jgi:hypothetical protein
MEEQFEDDPRAKLEKDYERFIPKPYMEYFLQLRFTSEDSDQKQPAGVTANYRGYSDK